MNNNDVIHLLEKSSTKADTEFSKNIFDVYEEGKEDTERSARRFCCHGTKEDRGASLLLRIKRRIPRGLHRAACRKFG